MGTNKFESEIQQKLQHREIQPSPSAWERLSNQLDTQENKKKKGWFLYVGYAASIAVFISLFLLMTDTKKDETIILDNSIVNNKITVPEIDKNFKQLIDIEKNKEVIALTPLNKTVENSIQKQEEKKPVIIKKKNLFKNSEFIKTDKTVIAKKSTPTIKKGIDTRINFKEVVKEEKVVANNEIKTLDKLKDSFKIESTKVGVSVDSDALLFAVTHSKEEIRGYYKKYRISQAKVLKTIQEELNRNNLKIDPSTILAEVEREVNEESFQNNFYQFIKKRVSDVAVAIANRNN
tara:strand:- start:1924 stop:2796 length:873 start_codon:yes stop_codon:yes gene_type:complete